MDNVWFIPLQTSITIPVYALSRLEINTLSGSSNKVLQKLKKISENNNVISPNSFKTYTETEVTECGNYSMRMSY
jgi:hypothetical protein